MFFSAFIYSLQINADKLTSEIFVGILVYDFF